MLGTFDCFAVVQSFFILTTILFIFVAMIFLNRSRHLRKKLSGMIEALAAKNKELEDARQMGQNALSPFIPETSKSIIVSIDQAGKITDINEYATEVFKYTREEMVGNDAFGTIFPVPEKKDSLQANIISRIFANPKLYVEHETENIKKNGEHFWISWTNRVIYDDLGQPTEIRSVGFDITKRKRLEEELRYLASVDPLTGVLNRQALLEAGARELKRAIRYKRQLSILVLKLNYFHGTSEKGNDPGFSDEIIRQAVTICRKATRDSDYIGRVGDIEFAIILPETPAENVTFLAERLKEKIQEKNLKDSNNFFVSASFGVAAKKNKEDTIDSLLLKALNALQEADKNERQQLIKQSKKKGLK